MQLFLIFWYFVSIDISELINDLPDLFVWDQLASITYKKEKKIILYIDKL